jgi:hypothetical protein
MAIGVHACIELHVVIHSGCWQRGLKSQTSRQTLQDVIRPSLSIRRQEYRNRAHSLRDIKPVRGKNGNGKKGNGKNGHGDNGNGKLGNR